MKYSPSKQVTLGSSTPNSSSCAKGPSCTGVRKGAGSATNRNPSGLRAKPMIDRHGAQMRTEQHDVFVLVLYDGAL